MLADGRGGAIVNLASIASLIGLADRFAHAGSGPKRPAFARRLSPGLLPLGALSSAASAAHACMHMLGCWPCTAANTPLTRPTAAASSCCAGTR